MFMRLKEIKVIEYQNADQMIKPLCCENSKRIKEECLERRCKKCQNKVPIVTEYEDNITSLNQWRRTKVDIIVKDKKKQIVKVVKENIEISIKDLVDKFKNTIPTFMNHVSNIVHQYR